MPTAPLQPCNYPGGCKELVPRGRCAKHATIYQRAMDELRGNSNARGYDSDWRRVREVKLANDPLCEDCLQKGLVIMAKDVHHKQKLGEHPELRLVFANLKSLCRACHNEYTRQGL